MDLRHIANKSSGGGFRIDRKLHETEAICWKGHAAIFFVANLKNENNNNKK